MEWEDLMNFLSDLCIHWPANCIWRYNCEYMKCDKVKHSFFEGLSMLWTDKKIIKLNLGYNNEQYYLL